MRTSTSSRVSAIVWPSISKIDLAVVADVGQQLGAALLRRATALTFGSSLPSFGPSSLKFGSTSWSMYLSRLVAELDLLDVQLFGDHVGVLFEPRLVRRVGQDHFDLRQRLAHLQLGAVRALRPSEAICRTRFIRSESCFVDRRRVAGRVVAEVDAFGHALLAEQRPARFCHSVSARNGTNGAIELRRRHQALVQRPVGVELFGAALVGRPEPVAAAADVPVRQRVDELGDRAGRRRSCRRRPSARRPRRACGSAR